MVGESENRDMTKEYQTPEAAVKATPAPSSLVKGMKGPEEAAAAPEHQLRFIVDYVAFSAVVVSVASAAPAAFS